SGLGDKRPQRIGAARGHHVAELDPPMRLVAEFLAPRPQPARRVVQRVLVGKAHRAVHLMRDCRAGPGRLADPQLGDRHLAGAGATASATVPSNETVSRGSPARLVPWLIARPSAGTSATDGVPA